MELKKINIEQIKKDWGQHCEEYGFKAVVTKYKHSRCISLQIEEGFENKQINIFEDGDIGINLVNVHDDFNVYKLFTSFYEKLMKGEIDV